MTIITVNGMARTRFVKVGSWAVAIFQHLFLGLTFVIPIGLAQPINPDWRIGHVALAPGWLIAHKRTYYMSTRPTTTEGLTALTLEAPETKIVETARVTCDGGEGAMGHPRVWLLIPAESGWVECPYCDCKYVLRGDSGQNN